MRWDSRHWKIVPGSVLGLLNNCVAAPQNMWAAGSMLKSGSDRLLHWNGATLTTKHNPLQTYYWSYVGATDSLKTIIIASTGGYTLAAAKTPPDALWRLSGYPTIIWAPTEAAWRVDVSGLDTASVGSSMWLLGWGSYRPDDLGTQYAWFVDRYTPRGWITEWDDRYEGLHGGIAPVPHTTRVWVVGNSGGAPVSWTSR
jgi:hypothetical protein